MFDFTRLAEEYERRARQADHAAACYRARQGPVPLAEVGELETKAETYRETAEQLREEGRRRRNLTIAYTTEDGVENEIRLIPQDDGTLRLEAWDDYLSDGLRFAGEDRLSGISVRVGETQESL